MAIAYPDGIVEDADSPHTLELETLEILRVALPDHVRVYHAVHWSKASRKGTFAGEIDFVVLGSRCRLVLVEQKNGPLVESDDGLHKQYSEQRKSIRAQMARSADHLRGKLGRRFGKGRVPVDFLQRHLINPLALGRQHLRRPGEGVVEGPQLGLQGIGNRRFDNGCRWLNLYSGGRG